MTVTTLNTGYLHNPRLPHRLLMNSEYEIFHRAEGRPPDTDPGLQQLREAGDWIGGQVRNWTRQREGGKFSLIDGACWVFTVYQHEAGAPVRVRVMAEFGRYHVDRDNPDMAQDTEQMVAALQQLIPAHPGELEWTLAPLAPQEPEYMVLSIEGESPKHHDELWAEMERVSAIIKSTSLRNVHQFIG